MPTVKFSIKLDNDLALMWVVFHKIDGLEKGKKDGKSAPLSQDDDYS